MRSQARSVATTARRAALRDLGSRLTVARKNSGFTQQAVAEHMKVSTQTVRNWEAGRTEPTGSAIQEMASLFGVACLELQEQAEDTRPGTEPTRPHERVKVDTLRLKAARRDSGLTQVQAAQRSKHSLSSIRRYETGIASPSKAGLTRLALVYRKPTRWFVQSDGPKRDTQELTMDEALRAYELVQPDLTTDSVRTIADFILFVHRQQLHRAREHDSCTAPTQVAF